jgi:threonine/homoserine/homoserine lactone efflux protein
MDYLLRGILIGLLFGLPVGAVGTMTVQRTWNGGMQAGLFTGLGSSVADCFYACVGVFGLTLISDFLLKYQVIINILGGSFVLFMGIRLLIKKEDAAGVKVEKMNPIKMFFSSFMVGVTNPAAILTFLFAFSYFGISADAGLLRGSMLVMGVLVGTYIWWGALSAVTCIIKKKTEKFNFRYMNRIFGSILSLFGIIVLLRLFFEQT